MENSSTFTLNTISTDVTKQCASSPSTKTKNGVTGVVAKMGYTLGAELNLAASKLTVSLPIRLKAYSDASVLGAITRESMLPSDLS